MRTLYLLRHAKSSWADFGLDDHDRPLNARGVESCTRLVPHLRQEGIAPDLVLCSTAERARATLHGIFPGLPAPLAVRFDPAVYLAAPGDLLALARATAAEVRRLMVIGHNPGLEDLARSLAGSGPPDALARLEEKFPTGALACFSFDIDTWQDLSPGTGRLCLFTLPRLLDA
ncbi:MAG: histidine phosphatase family protein [Sneathiellaceae bacterium]